MLPTMHTQKYRFSLSVNDKSLCAQLKIDEKKNFQVTLVLNVDRGLKNVSARGNLPQSSLHVTRQQNELSHVTIFKDLPCLRHPLPELLIIFGCKILGVRDPRRKKLTAYRIFEIEIPGYQRGIIRIQTTGSRPKVNGMRSDRGYSDPPRGFCIYTQNAKASCRVKKHATNTIFHS